MPIRTSVLDNGNFVYSPELAPKPGFSEYLSFADRLQKQWRKVHEDWSQSPFSFELGEQKRELDRVMNDFVETFKALYTLKSVEKDPALPPASRFFAQHRRVREPLWILHCDREMPLHTVLEFSTHEDLARLNAALNEDTPLRWWQTGPRGLPCYLFGDRVWELKPSETAHSEPGIVLVFLELSEKHQPRRDRLACGSLQTAPAAAADFLPEKVRVSIWRRARGKCEECGSHEDLDFASLTPASKGQARILQGTQLLCGRCREKVGVA